jgi:hypothetical protein
MRGGEVRQPLLNSVPEILQHPLEPEIQSHSFDILAQFGFPADEGVFNMLRVKLNVHLGFVSLPSGARISLAQPG